MLFTRLLKKWRVISGLHLYNEAVINYRKRRIWTELWQTGDTLLGGRPKLVNNGLPPRVGCHMLLSRSQCIVSMWYQLAGELGGKIYMNVNRVP